MSGISIQNVMSCRNTFLTRKRNSFRWFIHFHPYRYSEKGKKYKPALTKILKNFAKSCTETKLIFNRGDCSKREIHTKLSLLLLSSILLFFYEGLWFTYHNFLLFKKLTFLHFYRYLKHRENILKKSFSPKF